MEVDRRAEAEKAQDDSQREPEAPQALRCGARGGAVCPEAPPATGRNAALPQTELEVSGQERGAEQTEAARDPGETSESKFCGKAGCLRVRLGERSKSVDVIGDPALRQETEQHCEKGRHHERHPETRGSA